MSEETSKQNVAMSAEEQAEFEAFKAEKAKKAAAAKRKAMRDTYAQLVDDEVAAAVPMLEELSEQMRTVKKTVFDNFQTVLKMKSEMLGLVKDDQRSHTFTTGDGKYRLTIGINTVDAYRDTVEDGVAMVKDYISSLAKDEDTKVLVNAILRLLARDQTTGQLKASRVLQLSKMADESGNERFVEGVRIIRESYQPTTTQRYIRAEVRTEQNGWRIIPLSVTDVADE